MSAKKIVLNPLGLLRALRPLNCQFSLIIHANCMVYSVAEPGHFGRSRYEGLAPAPGCGSTLDTTEEILNDILFVRSPIQ